MNEHAEKMSDSEILEKIEDLKATNDVLRYKLINNYKELRSENDELRELVQKAYIAGCRSDGETTWWGDFQEWKAKHSVLMQALQKTNSTL